MNEKSLPDVFGLVATIMLVCSIIIGVVTRSFTIGALCFGGSFLLFVFCGASLSLIQKNYFPGIVFLIISLSLINWAANKAMFDGAILLVGLYHFVAVMVLITGLRLKALEKGDRFYTDALILIATCIGLYASFAPFVFTHRHLLSSPGVLSAAKVLFFAVGSSFWGIFYFVVISVVGYVAARKCGALFLPLAIFFYIATTAASYPDISDALNRMVGLGPVRFHRELLNLFAGSSNSVARGLMLLGLMWAWMLVPAFIRQLSMQKTLQAFSAIKQIIGSTIAQGFAKDQLQTEGALTVPLAMVLIIGGQLFVIIVLWKMLINDSSAIPFKLFWFETPDIRVPHWKPVWHYSYFMLAAVYFFLSRIFQRIQKPSQTTAVHQGRIFGEVIATAIMAMFIPAGVILFLIGHHMGKIFLFPFVLSAMTPGKTTSSEIPQKRYQAPQEPVFTPKPEPPFAPDPREVNSDPVVPFYMPEPSAPRASTGRLLFKHPREIMDIESVGPNVHFVLDSGGNLSRYDGNGARTVQVPDLDIPCSLWLRGEKIILGYKTGKIRIGNVDQLSGKSFSTLDIQRPFQSLAVNGFGTIYAFTSLHGREIFTFLHGPGKVVPLLDLGIERATVLAFSTDSQFLGIGTEKGDIMLYNMARRQVKKTFNYSTLPTWTNGWPQASLISFIDGGSLIAAYGNGRLAYWQDLELGWLEGVCWVKGRVTSLSHDPNSGRVVAGMDDGTVQLFALSELNTVLFSQKLHDAEVIKATLIDGRILSVGRDGTVISTKV